jgi:hypothetical protein
LSAAGRRLLVGTILLLVVAIVTIGYGVAFVAQDRCLDAGGRWDDATGVCSGAVRS